MIDVLNTLYDKMSIKDLWNEKKQKHFLIKFPSL